MYSLRILQLFISLHADENAEIGFLNLGFFIRKQHISWFRMAQDNKKNLF